MDTVSGFAVEFWVMSCRMAPWLLFGFLMAGILSVIFKPAFVRRHLGAGRFTAILKAALFGIPLPLCSCGVLPVALSLRKHGAGKGAAASFLISTPQTGVDSIVVTWSMLGWVFAVFKLAAAFVAGIVGGVLVEYSSGGDGGEQGQGETGAEDEIPERKGGIVGLVAHVFKYGFGTLLGDVAPALLVGLCLSALISLLLPPDWFGGGRGNELATMLLMLVVGIPLYVCSTASIPIAAALMLKGVSPGAALVFLIVGPAVNAAALSAITRIVGRRQTVVYLVTLSIVALASGALMNLLGTAVPGAFDACLEHCAEASVSGNIAGALLLALIAFSLIRKFFPLRRRTCCRDCQGGNDNSDAANVMALIIPDMNCPHCAATVESIVKALPGLEGCKANHEARTLTLRFSAAPPSREEVITLLKNNDFTAK